MENHSIGGFVLPFYSGFLIAILSFRLLFGFEKKDAYGDKHPKKNMGTNIVMVEIVGKRQKPNMALHYY